jgi:hypothetical protein
MGRAAHEEEQDELWKPRSSLSAARIDKPQ